jgi:hypothetical protein
LNFIRNAFKQDEHGSNFDAVRIVSPKEETHPCLAKEENTQITDEEISNALEKVSF